MEKNLNKRRYEAMGFIEALIAIVVVGMASIIIMDISARTMQEVIQNEAIDTMTQLAVEGSEMAQQVAKEALLQDDSSLFPTNISEQCYIVTSDGSGNYYFYDEDNDNEFEKFTLDERDLYKEEAKIMEAGEQIYEDYFRIICFQNDNTDAYLVTKTVVGLVVGDGNITKGNLVSDYKYFSVITLR